MSYCGRGRANRLTAWARPNALPVQQRVIHGLPLRWFYFKNGIKAVCSQNLAQTNGPAKPKDAQNAVSK